MFNWIIGIPLLTLFASVALVLAVIPSTRRETSRPTLNALLIVISTWAFSSFMFHGIAFPSSLFWMYLIIFCGLATGAVGVHFCVRFTEQTGAIAKWVVATFYVLCSLPLVPLLGGKIVTEATLLPDGAVEIGFGPIAPLLWSIISMATLIAIAVLVVTLSRSSQSEKRYIIYVLVGYILMCLGSLSNLFVSSYPVDIAANFIFISLVTYAVVSRYTLRPSLRQTWYLSLPVAGFALTLCYVALLTFCLKWLELNAGTAHLIAAITVTTFGAITFGSSRQFLSNKLTRYFFSGIYRYRKALSDIARVDRSLTQWTNSAINILNIIAKATSADDAVLLLQNSKTKYFEAKYAVGRNPVSILQLKFSNDSPLVEILVKRGTALSTEEIEQQITFKVLLRNKDDILQEIGPTLYCGVQGYDGLLAIIGLTHKSPHVWERIEDRDFLELASYQIAPLIINANLYQESQLEIEERKQVEEKIKHAAEEWRTTFDSITDLVSIHDKDFKLVRMNKAFADALKMKPRELIGKTCYEIVHEANEPVPNCPHKKIIETKKPTAAEFFEPHLGIHLEVSTSPIFNEEGEVVASVHVARDITERRQAEEALRESEERYRALLELGERIGEAVVMLQDDERGTGMHIFVSDQWPHITGYSREELLNMSMADLIHPRYREMAVERYERRIRGEVLPGFYEITIIRKDGNEVPVEVAYAYTQYKGKNVNVGYIRDITERKKMEEQLMVNDRLASIGELVSGVAHELNNPLTGVIGFSDLLAGRKDLPDDVKEDLKLINREAQRTAKIVKNLLTFARKHPKEKQPTVINKAIEAVLELRAYEQKVSNIEVNTRFASDLPKIMGNAFDLQQVFLNIIVNAEHAMLEAHGKGTITITTVREGDIIRVSLADDGPGIAKENLGHVFDPFFTTKEVGKGTGLGLSICYGTITEHGGRIYVESKLGKGATFIIELPVATTDNEGTANENS